MSIFLLLRKPLAEKTVAQNCITYKTGSLNIHQSRIGGGRWPTNVLIFHKSSCKKEGVFQETYIINQWTEGANLWGGTTGRQLEYRTVHKVQEVTTYQCTDSCPANAFPRKEFLMEKCYPQFSKLNQLKVYLETLITPPHGHILYYPFNSIEPDFLYDGAIILGDCTDKVEEIWEALKPGAHIIVIPPSSEPTNHTNACCFEDHGFEIRDSIFVPHDLESVHYASKPSVKEKNKGVSVKNNHPTVKPVSLMEKLVRDEPVLDPFMGSGTTGVACQNKNLNFVGIEKDEAYFQIAMERNRISDKTYNNFIEFFDDV